MPDALRLALTTLTVLRVRGPERFDRRTAGRAMELAPLVGVLLGLGGASVLYAFRVLADFRSPPLLPCALAVAALALLTGERGLLAFAAVFLAEELYETGVVALVIRCSRPDSMSSREPNAIM